MPRLLFEKTENSIWISHLDLMRLFQRAFKRADLHLKHTQGYNPRPSVSIALPLSVGVESHCELLDFDLEGDAVSNEEIQNRLNDALVDGVRVLRVYNDGAKIKNLALMDCKIVLEYDNGVPSDAVGRMRELFSSDILMVEKRSKNGMHDQDIIPMIRGIEVLQTADCQIQINARVCCQNPTLNPMLLPAAIERYLLELKPDFSRCCRVEIYDNEEKIFR